jgi:hypothetical protein
LSGTQVSSSDDSEEEHDQDDQDPRENVTTQKGTQIGKKDKVQAVQKAAKKVGFLFFS